MEKEVFNSESEVKEETGQTKILNWTSILILWIGIVYCGINGLLGELKVILAIIFLSISTITTYFNYRLGVKITLGVILIGVLNLIDFFPIKNLINFGIKGTIDIGFEYSLLGIGIVHYFTNRTELSKFLKYLFNRDISEEDIKSTQKSKNNRFKRKFSNKSISELEIIINSGSFVPEAISAAKELIAEKKNP